MQHSRHIPSQSWDCLSRKTKILCLVAKYVLLMDLFKIYWVVEGSYWKEKNGKTKIKRTPYDLKLLIETAKDYRHQHIQALAIELLVYIIVFIFSPEKKNIIPLLIAINVIHIYAIIFQTYNIFLAEITLNYMKKNEIITEQIEPKDIVYFDNFKIKKFHFHEKVYRIYHIFDDYNFYEPRFASEQLAIEFMDFFMKNKQTNDLLNLQCLGEIKRVYRVWSKLTFG